MAPILSRAIRLKRLTKTDVGWLHFKVALAIMLFVPLWQSPSFAATVTGILLLAWALVSSLGVLMSVAGLVLSAQNELWRQKGFRIEMTGLWLLMAGPMTFSAVQIGLLITTGRGSWLGVMFPYVIAAAIFCRMQMVRMAMRTVLYRLPGEVFEDEIEDTEGTEVDDAK